MELEHSQPSPESESTSPVNESPPTSDHRTSVTAVRILQPSRLFISMLAAGATLFVLGWALASYQGKVLSAEDWFDPVTRIVALGDELFDFGSGTATYRLILLMIPLSIIWSLAGGWITRSEFIDRRGQFGSQTNATQFVLARGRSLCMPFLLSLTLFCLGLLPGLVAGLLCRFGIGALVVAICLPTPLFVALVEACIFIGWLSYPMMPAALAAEGSDGYDALSRSYSYLFRLLAVYVALQLLCLAITSLPCFAAYILTRQLALVGTPAALILYAIAGMLSVSTFWTLQASVYIRVRRLADGTCPRCLWDGNPKQRGHDDPSRESDAETKSSHGWRTKVDTTIGPIRIIYRSLLIFGVGVLAWMMNSEILSWSGGRENTSWLRWGFGPQFAPEVEGTLYQISSYVAGFWFFLILGGLFLAPILAWLRTRKKREDNATHESEEPLAVGSESDSMPS